MKRTTIAVVLSLVLVALIAVPVMAAAQKVNVVACPINNPGLAGGGFVIFNNTSGPNNLIVNLSLKGVAANTSYDIYLFVDGLWHTGAKVGTVTTNKQGNGNFHLNTAVAPGTHVLNLDLTAPGTLADIYELPDIHTGGGVTMLFK